MGCRSCPGSSTTTGSSPSSRLIARIVRTVAKLASLTRPMPFQQLRAALSGISVGDYPRRRNGPVEQMRILMVARRSARSQRIGNIEPVTSSRVHRSRRRFEPGSRIGTRLGSSLKLRKLRPRKGSDPVLYTTQYTMRGLARRVQIAQQLRSKASMRCLPNSSTETAPSVGRGSTGSAPTQQPRSSSLQETTRSGCARNGRGHTCAASARSPQGQARPQWTGPVEPWRQPSSQRCLVSHRIDSYEHATSEPRRMWFAAVTKGRTPLRSCAASSATLREKRSNTSKQHHDRSGWEPDPITG